MPVPLRILYLFGAGATHAELANLEGDHLEEPFLSKKGLLIEHVSSRIIVKAQPFLRSIQMVSAPKGPMNIELFISLIENSRFKRSNEITARLKQLVKSDIEGILTKTKRKRFYLHKALLELHQHPEVAGKEKLEGLISLNYDTVLDEAFREIYEHSPNYSFELNRREDSNFIPLLKLHGSFNWNRIRVRGRPRSFEIIPLGASKNYLHIPYNFIWSRALELLCGCDVLRVVGCSLSPNDIHLIDLLFKAHIERGRPFEIQIIARDNTGEDIQRNYGFFREIKRLTEIEETLITELRPRNPFKAWLASKSVKLLKEQIGRTRYLKKLTA